MTNKVRITADAALAIIRSVFEDEDVNVAIDDPCAPEEWQGKTINEILNVEYFSFKHRPASSQQVIIEELEKRGQTNWLAALDKSFCLCSLTGVERLYSKDIDQVALSVTLDYMLQSSKAKLLEFLVEDSNIATSGLRLNVKFGEAARKVTIFFGNPIINDIQTGSPYGEVAMVSVTVVMMLYPDVVSYSDYTVNIGFTENGVEKNADIPLSSISIASIMTQEALPGMIAKEQVGNVNLSRATSFVLVFEGYNNPFINYLADKTLSPEKADNNEEYTLKITREGKMYTHSVIVKDHQIITNADTGNETHNLSLVKRGI